MGSGAQAHHLRVAAARHGVEGAPKHRLNLDQIRQDVGSGPRGLWCVGGCGKQSVRERESAVKHAS